MAKFYPTAKLSNPKLEVRYHPIPKLEIKAKTSQALQRNNFCLTGKFNVKLSEHGCCTFNMTDGYFQWVGREDQNPIYKKLLQDAFRVIEEDISKPRADSVIRKAFGERRFVICLDETDVWSKIVELHAYTKQDHTRYKIKCQWVVVDKARGSTARSFLSVSKDLNCFDY